MKLQLRDYPRIAIFVGLIAALGLIPAFYLFPGVPLTAQTLGVMLAGVILGKYRGTLAVLLFEVLVLAGLPLLSGGRGGFSVFVGPTSGFLYGWLAGTWVLGLLFENRAKIAQGVKLVLSLLLGGIVVVYAFGLGWLALAAQLNLVPGAGETFKFFLTWIWVFLVWDLGKVVVSVFVFYGLKTAYPKALVN
jgi:biotin transport system substrate-specific component